MFQKTTLILLFLAFASCKNSDPNKNDKIKTAQWLLGNWESKIAEGVLTETWLRANDSTFTATSYFIKNKDTLHNEKIKLQQIGEHLFYFATVKGQNNDKAIPFKQLTTTAKELVFENSKNDYPKKITYTIIDKDSLVASISGIQLGKPRSEKFGMKKMP